MKKNKTVKNKLLIALVLILIIGITTSIFLYFNNRNDSISAPQTNNDSSESINYEPPTEQEKSAGNEAKDRIRQQDEIQKNSQPSSGSSAGKRVVQPVVSSVELTNQSLDVAVFVPNVIDEGECVIQAKYDNLVVKRTVLAVKESSTAYCPLISVPRSELSKKGAWSVTATYITKSSEGTSEAKNIEVN